MITWKLWLLKPIPYKHTKWIPICNVVSCHVTEHMVKKISEK